MTREPGSGRPAGAAARRLVELDVLRAVAVVAVLGSHFPFLGKLDRLHVPAPVLAALRVWERAGWLGVDLFFVLSGFLVSGLLFREYARDRRVDGKTFFLRRGLKIYPAFYFFLLVSAPLIAKIADPVPPVVYWVRFAGEVMFLQNYYGSLWNHTWTLAVEEHFYLLLLALVLVLARRGRGAADPFRRIPVIFAGVAVLALASRLYLANELVRGGDVDLEDRILVWTHNRIDSLFFGVVISYAWHFRAAAIRAWTRRWWPALLVVAVAGVAPAMTLARPGHLVISTIGFTLQYLAFGALLLVTLVWAERPGAARILRRLAPLAWVGRHSYSVYLWHMVVATFGVHFLRAALGRTDLLGLEMTVYVVGAVVVGVALSLLVEQPVLELRERWLPSRSGAVPHQLAAGTSRRS